MASIALVSSGYRNATAKPVVRHLSISVDAYPSTSAPLRIVLFSDLHVHGPDMPPSRVSAIVRQINTLHPDIVVAAGDFVGNNWIGRDYSVSEAITPLAGLRARFGAFAVLGNNDFLAGSREVTRELERAGIHVLSDQARRVGPVVIGGLGGRLRDHRALVNGRRRTYRALKRMPGVKVLVTHRPDEFVSGPRPVSLVLAGHTHCGQLVLPFIGPLETGSDYGSRYVCGLYQIGPTALVVTAGLGTSYVPLRIGAPPDIWVITIRAR